MKKVIITAIAASALLSLGTAMADPDNGNGNQGCDATNEGGPYKNPGKMFQAIRLGEEGLNPAEKAARNPNSENVGEFIAFKCKS